MGHDTLNKSISIPDLPPSSHNWHIPNADTLYNDHLIDPLANNPLVNEALREDWLGDETNSNPLVTGEKDVEESRYGSKLGSLAMGLNETDDDEELDLLESDDKEKE